MTKLFLIKKKNNNNNNNNIINIHIITISILLSYYTCFNFINLNNYYYYYMKNERE